MPASQIQPLVLNDVGVYGLNSQASPSALEPQWLSSAINVILDEQGRISTRKGFQQVTETLSAGEEVQSIFEYYKSNGSTEIIVGTDSNIYKINETTTPYLLTAQTRTGTPQTITSGHWQWVNFNEKLYGVQSGHTPVYYSGTAWTDLVDLGSYNPPPSITTFDPNCILGEYGRLWVGGITENSNVIYYSDTLQGDKWNTGASGQLDLKTVWGGDSIQGLAAFQGKLVIFGEYNIAIYQNPWDPSASDFQLEELIEGVGLKARDSIAHMGSDLIFLSNTGLTSLGRTVLQNGSLPITNYSKNIRDELALNIVNNDMQQCKSAYCLCGGFYLLSFPDRNLCYYFDFTIKNPDGTPRVSKFVFNSGEGAHALLSTVDGRLWVGRNNTGNVALLRNYYDQFKTDVTATYGTEEACETAGHTWESTNSKCWQTTNQSYDSSFRTVWMDFNNPAVAKLLKRFFMVIEGGRGMDVAFTTYRDYNSYGDSQYFTLSGGTTYVYGGTGSLFGSAKYATSGKPIEYKISMGKSAKEVQIEMTGSVKGYKASLQNMTLLAKAGKVR